MPRSTLLRQRMLTLFLAAMMLLFSPLVLQFEAFGRWLGIPILLLYIFAVWAAVIALAAWLLSRGAD
ncbi:hypothetical protein G3480_14555 [Thiorhodococcus mannitoliphagus]|uniref:DUF3311 domain-containing protein n=1 Tax=Thiorhodococcus mannitoliphagus TaxID=329406 RepID=A0A6P1E1A3_9GAMM|nr:hypothetical protein [Thiorhodococcus mannitoliphagus]NEX21515.1 hypothetical protein [Thiorhodococcus mannitoliphagus]